MVLFGDIIKVNIRVIGRGSSMINTTCQYLECSDIIIIICAGDSDSIAAAGQLDCGFHPSGAGQVRSN